MRSIILAAGQGTRLLPLTANMPKCLVELKGRALLDWQLSAIRRAGISDITVVTGYCSEQISSKGLQTVYNSEFATTNMVASLFKAREYLRGDILISYGDIVFSSSLVQRVMQSNASIGVAVDLDWYSLWRLRMEDPLADAETLKIDCDGRIIEIGKTPSSIEEIHGQYIGMIKISASIVDDICLFYEKMDRNMLYDNRTFDNMFMTSFITELINESFPVTAIPIRGNWCEVDSVSDLQVYENSRLEYLEL